jgi:hypothetical protein
MRYKDPSKVIKDRTELERLVAAYKGNVTVCPASYRRENPNPVYHSDFEPRQRKREFFGTPAEKERRDAVKRFLLDPDGVTNAELWAEFGRRPWPAIGQYVHWYQLKIMRSERKKRGGAVRYWIRERRPDDDVVESTPVEITLVDAKPVTPRRRGRPLGTDELSVQRREIIVALLTRPEGVTRSELREALGFAKYPDLSTCCRQGNLEVVRTEKPPGNHPAVRYWCRIKRVERKKANGS